MILDHTKLTAIIDTREQKPLNLTPFKVIRKSIPTGDYSLVGLESHICVERKEFSDLVGCMTSSRERFEKELHRMRAYPFRCIVVEGSYSDLAAGNYRSKLNPISALHSVSSWVSKYQIPIMFVGDANAAADFVKHYMYSTAQRLFEKNRKLTRAMVEEV